MDPAVQDIVDQAAKTADTETAAKQAFVAWADYLNARLNDAAALRTAVQQMKDSADQLASAIVSPPAA